MTTTRHPLTTEVLKGEHDAILDELRRAIESRKKVLFRKNSRVRLIGTGSPTHEGREGRIKNVGAKRVTVEFDDGTGMYVPASMLEVL